MQKSNSSLIAIITVFFFWGFVAASNGILIPLFKAKFNLTQFQSQLVDLAFYSSYFFGSIIYYILSLKFGDPIAKFGYKTTLVFGLLLSSAGALIFIPAANLLSYPLLLCALFTIAFGFAIQQIVANPFVINFGNKAKGAQRLSLAGGINSFGTTIGPVFLSYALFGSINKPSLDTQSIESVKLPALILCALFLICAFIIFISKFPKIESDKLKSYDLSVLKYPQLTLGMLAIFMYVGVEVTIQSNMGALLAMPEIKGLDHTKISHFISLYWGGLMIGRWTGSLSLFNFNAIQKKVAQLIIPLVAFSIIYFINTLNGSNVDDYWGYLPFVIFASLLFISIGDNPAKTLGILSLSAMLFMFLGIITKGNFALYCFLSGGLFCSVMWPCIFALAINGLGKYTNQGAAFLIMMILGGAIIPPLQGWIGDKTNPHQSYIVTVFCFAYLTWYAKKTSSMFKQKHITRDVNATGH
ncbi:MAG: MFS transporter [Bacteroidetes bacterium]|nr:MFS transporter [Bacteroidota bacterium]